MDLLDRQIERLRAARREVLRAGWDPAVQKVKQLLALKGIGSNSAWLHVTEFFEWRAFRNRKQVGALAGLTPTRCQSGEVSCEQGIAKAGNCHVRAIAIEIAWGWLRFQPRSALACWYQEGFGGGSSRLRRIGIVALARKLSIALWQYLETRVLPEGAELKPASGSGRTKRRKAHRLDLAGAKGSLSPPGSRGEPTVKWSRRHGLLSRLRANAGSGASAHTRTRIEGRPRAQTPDLERDCQPRPRRRSCCRIQPGA